MQSIQFLYKLCLCFFIFTSACSGQEQDGSRRISAVSTVTDDTTYVDPLFFVEGQLCQHLRRIFQDSKGNLWFGTNIYGVMRYNGDTLEYFDEKDGLGMGRITSMLEDEAANVWFATSGGLTKYDGVSFTNYTAKDEQGNNSIWGMVRDQDGVFWLGTLEGVSKFDGEKFTAFPIPKATVSDTTSILSYNRVSVVLKDSKGTLWFGTDGFGICKYDGEHFTQVTTEDGLCDNNIAELMEDSKGNVWIGTMFGGVSRYDGESFTNFTKDGIIKGLEISGLYEDNEGNIWFAAENEGVYRYDGNTFTNYYKGAGIQTNGMLAMLKDREGRFWFGGWGGLFRYDGQSFFSITKDGPWKP